MSINLLVSVEVLNPAIAIVVLTNGNYFELPEDATFTNLELKRAFNFSSVDIENNYRLKVQCKLLDNGLHTAVEKYQFKQFLGLLLEVLNKISEDILGREALNELHAIEIDADENYVTAQKIDK